MPHPQRKRCASHFYLILINVLTSTDKKRIVIRIESISLDEESTMIDDSPTPHGQEHLSDACLWLVGAPLTVLDTLYLTRLAPPIDAEHPETLIVWALGVAALLLLSPSQLRMRPPCPPARYPSHSAPHRTRARLALRHQTLANAARPRRCRGTHWLCAGDRRSGGADACDAAGPHHPRGLAHVGR